MSDDISTEDIERALGAILADERFSCAPRMSAFLDYVVRQTIAGHADRIKAYTIGVDALGKPETFDPQTDPSVRVLAKRLRASLCDYHERHPELPLVIEIRCGRYRPLFLTRSQLRSQENDRNAASAPAVPRPSVPIVRIADDGGCDAYGLPLGAIIGGILSRCDDLGTVRRPQRPATLWPEDYEIAAATMRLPGQVRIELQLVHAVSERVIGGTTLLLDVDDEGAASRKSLAEALRVTEGFAKGLMHVAGDLLRDYRRRGELSPYMVNRLARESSDEVLYRTPGIGLDKLGTPPFPQPLPTSIRVERVREGTAVVSVTENARARSVAERPVSVG